MRQLFIFLILFTLFIYQGNAQIVINEYSAHKGLEDLGDSFDWIELYNSGNSAEDLENYYLTDNLSNLEKWNLPSTQLGPGEFIAFCASGKNITEKEDHWESLVVANDQWKYYPASNEPPQDWNTLNFNDDSWQTGQGGFGYGDGDDNTLVQNVPSIYLRKVFTISDLEDIQSMILHPDFDDAYVAYLNGSEISRSTNIEGNPPTFDQNINTDMEANLYQGQIPEAVFFDNDEVNSFLVEGENVLAIQVHNFSSTSSDMSSNFFLSASIISNDFNYQNTPSWFPNTSSISYYHTNFKLREDEPVILSQNSIISDFVQFDGNLRNGISKGRSPDASSNWCYFDSSSPGESNSTSECFLGFSEDPVINLNSGWYDQVQMLLVQNGQSDVYFTKNGDIPDTTDQLFTQAIEINQNCAYSFKSFSNANLLPSRVVDRIFIFEEDNHDLPVISVYTDSLGLWSYTEGIYVSGPNAQAAYPYFGSNFWEPWSRFSRMEMFDKNKFKIAEENFDLEIHGGWSRAEPQKSFRFDFKSEYTGDLEVPIFQNKPNIEAFNNLNIRNGGQHIATDKMQDALISRLAYDTHIDNEAFQPTILYLNGEYWGVYGIREKLDQHYLASNHQADPDSIDLLNSFGVLNGTSDHFSDSYVELMNEDVSSPNFFNLFSQKFDTENYIDYFILQTYIQNRDWMGIAWGANNIKLWRPQSEFGKWRYMLFDTDGAFGFFGQNIFNNYIEEASSPLYPTMHSQIFDKLLENNQFKCTFTNRYADLMNTTFQPANISNLLETIESEMINAMPDHVSNWAAPSSISNWQNGIENIENYNSLRLPQARNHLAASLALGEQHEVELMINPPGAGTIKINSITPDNYPWDGIYYMSCPVSIEVIPSEGFSFQNWGTNAHFSNISFDSMEIVQLFSDDIFTANFTSTPNNIDDLVSTKFSLFPNPGNGIYAIQNDGQSEIEKVKIFDSLGSLIKVIFKQTSSLNQIDITELPDGIYYLQIETDKDLFNLKLIKKG